MGSRNKNEMFKNNIKENTIIKTSTEKMEPGKHWKTHVRCSELDSYTVDYLSTHFSVLTILLNYTETIMNEFSARYSSDLFCYPFIHHNPVDVIIPSIIEIRLDDFLFAKFRDCRTVNDRRIRSSQPTGDSEDPRLLRISFNNYKCVFPISFLYIFITWI